MGNSTAYNRHRRQHAAEADAGRRAPLEVAESQEVVQAVPDPVDNLDELGSPPYADVGQLINIQSDADLDRETEAMRQAELNKTRVLDPDELAELQNAHLRDPKTKAIPDADENGVDRTLKGQRRDRQKAAAPYLDPRSPELDGKVRSTEPEEKRPDADTSVSPKTAQDPTPVSEDDDPKLVEKIDADPPPKRRGKASQTTDPAA